MTVRYLLFDFFGTLVHYRDGVIGNAVDRSLRWLRERGLDLEPAHFTSRWQGVWEAIDGEAARDLREVHMHEGARRFFDGLAFKADEATIERFVAHYIDDWNEGVVDIDGLADTLATLDQDASIVSNSFYPPLVPGHVNRMGLRSRFQHVHTSITHGYRKPHPSIYRTALDAAGVRATETLFVGDNPECDYHGPRALGMRAVLVSTTPWPGVPETHRIGSVLELPAWIERAGGS